MNSDSENFEELRRLLALKRHEQPPPGYFEHFSQNVIVRIKAGEQGDASGKPTWLQRFWTALEARPAFAGAFGAAVCAILISGILNSEETAISSTPVLNPVDSHAAVSFGEAPTLVAAGGLDGSPLGGTNAGSIKSLFEFQLSAQPQLINSDIDLLQQR